MKKIVYLLLICSALFFCSCRSEKNIINKNQKELMSGGEFIGTLPDGRMVHRYEIETGPNMHNHFLYVIDNTQTISENQEEDEGEHSVNETTVIIGGKKYTPEK